MSAAPSFRVDLGRQGVWHTGIAVTVLAAIAAIGTWAQTASLSSPTGRWALASICTLVAAGIGASLWRQTAASLAWDGRRWHLCASLQEPGEDTAGDLAVMIDLGGWMLLRHARAAAGGRPRRRWVPVQRRGLEPHWHLLRCAVYSPRPEPGTDAAADSRPPA